MQNKKCTKCKKIKPLNDFWKHTGHRDGFNSQCKNCCKKNYLKNRKKRLNHKRIKRADPEYRKKELLYKKEYRQKNKKAILKYNKEYCQKNPEWAKEKARLYYWRHRDKRMIKIKEYKVNNRALYNELNRKRRNLKNSLPVTLTEKEWNEILRKYSYRCYYCGEKAEYLEKEHKIPLSRGGGYTKENIVPSCRGCNAKKHTLTESEFIERQIRA